MIIKQCFLLFSVNLYSIHHRWIIVCEIQVKSSFVTSDEAATTLNRAAPLTAHLGFSETFIGGGGEEGGRLLTGQWQMRGPSDEVSISPPSISCVVFPQFQVLIHYDCHCMIKRKSRIVPYALQVVVYLCISYKGNRFDNIIGILVSLQD